MWSFLSNILCITGSHHWQDEGDGQEGVLLRSTCCGVLKVLKPLKSDWTLVGVTPAQVPVNEFLIVGQQRHYMLRPDWWMKHMKRQRWDKCDFYGCGMPIRCSASQKFCLFHHDKIEVKNVFTERELRLGRVI